MDCVYGMGTQAFRHGRSRMVVTSREEGRSPFLYDDASEDDVWRSSRGTSSESLSQDEVRRLD